MMSYMVMTPVRTNKLMEVMDNLKKIKNGNYHIITNGNHCFYQKIGS